jgi:hypothetical protein
MPLPPNGWSCPFISKCPLEGTCPFTPLLLSWQPQRRLHARSALTESTGGTCPYMWCHELRAALLVGVQGYMGAGGQQSQ